jgi:MFS family permease
VPFLDELWSGVLVVDSAAIEREHGLAHGGTAFLLLALPQLVAAALEARVVLWAEGRDPRRALALATLCVAVCALAAALAPTAWMLGMALAVASPAAGCVCGLAEVTLIAANPGDPERVMTRWTLAGSLGDLAAPALVALATLAGSWRFALVGCALLLGTHALLVSKLARPPDAEPESSSEEPAPSPRRAPRSLWIWLAAATACTLLDEILASLAALHLETDLHATPAASAAALAAWAFGSGVGLVVTAWALGRVAPRRLLVIASLACAAVASIWPVLGDARHAAAGLFLLGFTAAPLFPLATAAAYAAVPGRAALVAALEQIFVPFEIAAPWLLGVAADRFGLRVALGLLVACPAAVVLAVAAGAVSARGKSGPTSATKSP